MEKFTTGTVRPMKPPGLALSVAAAPALYPSKDPVLSSVAPVAAPSRTTVVCGQSATVPRWSWNCPWLSIEAIFITRYWRSTPPKTNMEQSWNSEMWDLETPYENEIHLQNLFCLLIFWFHVRFSVVWRGKTKKQNKLRFREGCENQSVCVCVQSVIFVGWLSWCW